MKIDIAQAIKTYHSTYEIGNAEINRIFPKKKSSATVAKMKKAAYEEMAKRNLSAHSKNSVNTVAAFEAWGINITDLENRYKSLKRLGLLENDVAENRAAAK